MEIRKILPTAEINGYSEGIPNPYISKSKKKTINKFGQMLDVEINELKGMAHRENENSSSGPGPDKNKKES